MKKVSLMTNCLWFIFTAVGHSFCSENLQLETYVANVSPQKILILYQLAKDAHEVFVKYGIEYWIQGGTLLGAVRHSGLIPWDDDLDWSIRLCQEQEFLNLKPVFECLGYKISKYRLGYAIYVPGSSFGALSAKIDIFFTVEGGSNRIYYDPSRNIQSIKRDGGPLYITKDELYPLKLYKFGELELFGPHDPITLLTVCYGGDWPTIAYKWHHDSHGAYTKKERVELKQEDLVPAQPTGPLQDRTSLFINK